jgi:hypothetical protein
MPRASVQLLGRPKVLVGEDWLEFLPDQRYGLLTYLAYQGNWVSRESWPMAGRCHGRVAK